MRVKQICQHLRHISRMLVHGLDELVQNVEYTGFHQNTDDDLRWRLLLLSHSLEKGLSVANERIDFGVKKAQDLVDIIRLYELRKLDKNAYEYLEATSILSEYINFRKMNSLEIDCILRGWSPLDCSLPSGTRILRKEDVNYDVEHFKELCEKRHSIREYGNKYISKDDIISALKLARYAPSACNRQMIKVFFSENADINLKIADVIPGNTGSKTEKAVYLLICADKSAFDYFEVNQWFVNGGIFLAYLQLAFASLNYASCIYQWPDMKLINKQMHELLKIPERYSVVAALSVGYYKESFHVICSCRKNVYDFYHEV